MLVHCAPGATVCLADQTG